jgi:hypothetical protein
MVTTEGRSLFVTSIPLQTASFTCTPEDPDVQALSVDARAPITASAMTR